VARVLVVEDSEITREYLCALMEQDPALQLAGVARDGLEAVEQAHSLRPDVILMDVHMPRMGGLEATRRIMAQVPTPIILATAGLAADETDLGFEAIRAGALTVIDKPGGLDSPEAQGLVRTVKLMAEVRVVRRWPARTAEAPAPAVSRAGQGVRVVAIGASTGGPAALAEILSRLRPSDVPAPVLVVQHITPGFTPGLVEWLAKETPMAVRLARGGEAAREGTVYVAPDAVEMGIDAERRLVITPAPSADGLHPTVDHLFASVALSQGARAMGILLTGMGRDGASGLARLRQAGAVTVAQDEASSVIFGMPGEAIRQGAVQHVLPPAEIARFIQSVVSPPRVVK
jgi:two-component system chemotaxis response regulator CheB